MAVRIWFLLSFFPVLVSSGVQEPMAVETIEIAIEDIEILNVTEFVAYWDSLRGERFAPSWKKFNLLALDTKIIPKILVVDVLHQPLNFVYRFWGTAHVRAKHADKTGKTVVDYPHLRGEAAFNEYSKIVKEKRPLAVKGTIDLPELGGLPFTQTIVRLPLSDDGIEVDKIVSIAIWDEQIS